MFYDMFKGYKLNPVNYQNIRNNIKRIRQEKKISLASLAIISNVKITEIRNFETGLSNRIASNSLRAIATAMGVDVAEFYKKNE